MHPEVQLEALFILEYEITFDRQILRVVGVDNRKFTSSKDCSNSLALDCRRKVG